VLSFFCTVATFGMPQDVAFVELSIESFLPVDSGPGAPVGRLLRSRLRETHRD
jgi:hypothetical protein